MPLNDLAPTLTRRLLAGAIACALVVPAPAFAQGAGDDQYRDPFPETTAQDSQADETPTETTGDGLSDTPPTSGDTSTGSGTSTETPDTGSSASEDSEDTGDAAPELAQTGDDPWLIALAGGSLLLLGAGLRLRGGAQRRH